MKNPLKLALSLITFSATCLSAQPKIANYGPENIDDIEVLQPFSIDVFGDAILEAKISKAPFKGQKVSYSEVEAIANYVFYYDKCHSDGLYASVGYDVTNFDWSENIYFLDKRFDTAIFAIGGFTGRIDNWYWTAYGTMNLDVDHFCVNKYTTYDALLWGRYAYQCDLGLHIGVLALVGMNINHYYPIIGFDWQISDRWLLNAVFPTNISLEYTYNQNWSFAIENRMWDSRHRVGNSEPLSKGLLNYRNWGTEFAVNYNCNSWMFANIHAGYTYGGRFTVGNKHYDRSRHFDLDATPYFGGEIHLKF